MSYPRLAALLLALYVVSFSANGYQQTRPAGGVGGAFFRQSCESDEVMVGISGRSAASIVALRPICAAVDNRGRWMSSLTRGDEIGGTGGTAFDIRCNNDEVVRGISGTAGAAIDSVAVLCSPLENGRVGISPPKMRNRAGGTGGRAYGPLDCQSEPAQGIAGAAGDVVTWIALICNLPANQQPVSDVVKIADITVNPPLAIGAATKINLSIQNPTAAFVRVPWRITVDGRVIASRTVRVPPTADRAITFSTDWSVSASTHSIRAELDPSNSLNEPAFHRINNLRILDVIVPSISCAKGMRAVMTPAGQRCIIASDAATCSAPGPVGMGPRKKFACSSNADCALGYVCASVPCGGVCLRDR